MDPKTLALILSAAAGGAEAIGGAVANNKKRKTDAATTAAELQAQRDLANQRVAADESMADPFRHQMAQAGDISKLDRMERGAYTPVHLGAAPGYESYVPQMSGGFSYEKSPEMISSAAALKRNVMAGNVAPTMTNPANYGSTAALNLVKIAADGVDPAGVSASGARGVTPSTPGAPPQAGYLADVPRRGGSSGGVLSGAAGGAGLGATAASIGGPFTALGGALIGGAAGAIKGMVTKKAKTAPRDVDVATATNVLTRVIRDTQGRLPAPGEIEQMLAGQGLKPGDHWVGEGGLMGLIGQLQQQTPQSGMQPSYVGHG